MRARTYETISPRESECSMHCWVIGKKAAAQLSKQAGRSIAAFSELMDTFVSSVEWLLREAACFISVCTLLETL